MNTYEIYVRAADRLCNERPTIANFARFSERLRRLHIKIQRSQLTVYQKEYLLHRLVEARAIAGQHRTPTIRRKQAGKHRDAELLAA